MTSAEGDARVVVVGEALIDIVQSADGRRTEHVGGSPANVAFGLARLGRTVDFYSSIGTDQRGDAIASQLSRAGVRIAGESRVAPPTSTALATLAADGSAQYEFDIRWALPTVSLPGAAVLHTGSIALFLEPGAEQVMRLIEAATSIVTLDPNIRPALIGERDHAVRVFERAAQASHVVKLSDEDARWLYPEDSEDAALRRVADLGPAMVVLTRGAEGTRILGSDALIEIPAPKTTVVDTIGAGDSFMASLIDSICRLGTVELDEQQLVQIGTDAAAVAAITVSRAGAMPPTRAELLAWRGDVRA